MAAALRAGAGGIAGLHALLIEHGEAIEWDLSHYHRRSIADLFTGHLRWWQLRAYLSHLPRESALARKLLGPDAAWGLSEQLLAIAVDQLRAGNWQRGGGKGAKPKPIPRPGTSRSSEPVRHGRTDRDPDEVRAYLDRFKPSAT
ncbi:hypothetical protein [Planobispora rosea]|uniref:hypothetical protein n=1 Tax=Planobispora rosea TaxID=35762 RepID=UPI00083A42FA|nr:hypothetical protein [Planobispora rosea]